MLSSSWCRRAVISTTIPQFAIRLRARYGPQGTTLLATISSPLVRKHSSRFKFLLESQILRLLFAYSGMRYLLPFTAEDDFTAVLLRKDILDPVKISGAVSDAMRKELDQRHSDATPECAEAFQPGQL